MIENGSHQPERIGRAEIARIGLEGDFKVIFLKPELIDEPVPPGSEQALNIARGILASEKFSKKNKRADPHRQGYARR
ncbi:MAG: hypothetical protein ACREGG_04860 [Candidatus Saccharimonadales bacterium]